MQGVFILLFSQRAQRHMKLLDRKPDAFFISVKSRSSLVEGEEGSYLPYWRLKIGQILALISRCLSHSTLNTKHI